MQYWWVNHGQSYRTELRNGYIWAPLTSNSGRKNEGYLNLSRTSINDIIFSYANGQIQAIGVVAHPAKEMTKPDDYRRSGNQWAEHGWLVDVKWVMLDKTYSPRENLQQILPLLPLKYSPLLNNGNAAIFYLASISYELGETLLGFIQADNWMIRSKLLDLNIKIDEDIQVESISNKSQSTIRWALVEARIGQGPYKTAVEKIEKKCRLTGVTNSSLLIASHIKPWKDSNDEEKLDGHNGFLLAPHVDKLFDRGYITFTDEGNILIASDMIRETMNQWGLNPNQNVGRFTSKQREYLNYHREIIYKERKEKLKHNFSSSLR